MPTLDLFLRADVNRWYLNTHPTWESLSALAETSRKSSLAMDFSARRDGGIRSVLSALHRLSKSSCDALKNVKFCHFVICG